MNNKAAKILFFLLIMTKANLPQCPSKLDNVKDECPDECIYKIIRNINQGIPNVENETKYCIPLVSDAEDCKRLDKMQCQLNNTEVQNPICTWGTGKNQFCYKINQIDLCEIQYISKKDCLTSTTTICMYDQNKCQEALNLQIGCQQNLSYQACKYIQDQSCTWDQINQVCIPLTEDDLKECNDALNQFACEQEYEQIQCIWHIDKNEETLTRCVPYQPSQCQGDKKKKPLQYVCDQLNFSCQWDNDFSNCELDQIDGQCFDVDHRYYLNEYACKQKNLECNI